MMVMTWESLWSEGIWSINCLWFHRSKDNFRSLNFGERGCPLCNQICQQGRALWSGSFAKASPDLSSRTQASLGTHIQPSLWIQFIFLEFSCVFILYFNQISSFLKNFLWEEFSFAFGVWLLIPLDTRKNLFRNIKSGNCCAALNSPVLGQLWAALWGPGTSGTCDHQHPEFCSTKLAVKKLIKLLTWLGTPCFRDFKQAEHQLGSYLPSRVWEQNSSEFRKQMCLSLTRTD